jgi:hypothetical protein
MCVLDPGHKYTLTRLDTDGHCSSESLRFVKRIGAGYPGNVGPAHAGTNMQEVLRALIDRLKYVREQALQLNDESSAIADARCISQLRDVLWRLEERAARRHGRPWPCVQAADSRHIEEIDTCPGCGHIGCEGRACGR